jgi:opacity protein-like surface antigen
MGRAPLHTARIAASLLGLLIAHLVAGAHVQAQGRRSDNHSGLGLGLLFAMPRGEFAVHADPSLGLGTYLQVDFGGRSHVGLRLDGSMVYYGSETTTQSFSTGPGITEYGDVTIRNRIGSFFIGPQLTFGSGGVRPYIHAGVGLSYFWTGTDFDDPYYECDDYGWNGDCEGDFYDALDLDLFFEGETDYSRWTSAWTAGGGVSVALGGAFSLYFALQYMNNGRVSYLREGAIVDHGDGYYSFTPIESDANLLVAQFGFAIQ